MELIGAVYGGDGPDPRESARDQAVADVSPGNDWSIVKVWYPPSGALGATPFPAYGFVHPRVVTAGR